MTKKLKKSSMNIPYSEGLGLFLKQSRIDADLSQNEVAEALKITPQYVSQWERGKQSPSCDLLASLIGILKIDQSELLEIILKEERVRLSAFFKKTKRS